MRKKIVSFAAAMLLLTAMCISAIAAEPRAVGASPSLRFNGTTANCSVIVNGNPGDDIDAVLSLYRGNSRIASWPGKGTTAIYISGSASGLTKGVTYTVRVSGTVGGEVISSTPMSVTC